MQQSEDGREGLKKEERRQDRHLEKAVMRSVEEDTELWRAEEEQKRKLVEIENDDGPRGSEEREARSKDHPSDDARGTKRRTYENMRRQRHRTA